MTFVDGRRQHSGSARRSGLVPVETAVAPRLCDRLAFKASTSGRRITSRSMTTSDERARRRETVTDRLASWPVI
jgi:hypothetical protein